MFGLGSGTLLPRSLIATLRRDPARRRMTLVTSLLLIAGISAVITTSAVAAPSWNACIGVSAGEGVFEESNCSKYVAEESSTGAFELEETTAETTSSEATMKLILKNTSLGTVEVECSMTDKGTVAPESEGTITSASFSSCKNVKGCSGTIKVEAVGLPWKTELSEENEKIVDKLKSDGSGAPGWSISCTGLSATCTSEATDTIMENAESGIVDADFKGEETGTFHCGCPNMAPETGQLSGTDKVKAAVPIKVKKIDFVWKAKPFAVARQFAKKRTIEKATNVKGGGIVLEGKAGAGAGEKFKIKCTTVEIEKGVLKGASNIGENEELVKLMKCSAEAGQTCKLMGEPTEIGSELLDSEIVEGFNKSAGKVLVLFTPKTATQVFKEFKLEGVGCALNKVNIGGSVLAETEPQKDVKKNVTLKFEPAEKGFYITAAMKKLTAGLTSPATTITGEVEIEIKGGELFGAF